MTTCHMYNICNLQYIIIIVHSWLVKVVMLEASELGSKVRWVENLKEEIGWTGSGVMVEDLGRLSNGEVAQMLRDSICGGQ